MYVALIAFFNYYYTFLQLEPKDLADSLKRQARTCSVMCKRRASLAVNRSILSQYLGNQMLRHVLNSGLCNAIWKQSCYCYYTQLWIYLLHRLHIVTLMGQSHRARLLPGCGLGGKRRITSRAP